ncbi:FkbM family methyltransferase [Mycolicibacterium sp. XJ1819]
MMTRRFFAHSWLTGVLRFPVSRHLPQGIYLARDVRRFFPDLKVNRIFDVGANEGQTAIQLALAFREARIDSFEPARETYNKLVKRVDWNKRIHCHQLALAAESGTSKMMTDTDYSHSFRMDGSGTETVVTTTASEFCSEHNIDTVNLMKVDTEGYDLEVLKGAEDLIKEHRIDLIQVEAGMNPENDFHVPYADFVGYLEGFGYRLLGIYDQSHEWPNQAPNLRRANIAFMSEKLNYGSALTVRW